MTVNQALIVCEVLKRHGYGDYDLTVESGYGGISEYPDYVDHDKKFVNMEGCKYNKQFDCVSEELLLPCDEIDEELTNAEKIRNMADEGLTKKE